MNVTPLTVPVPEAAGPGSGSGSGDDTPAVGPVLLGRGPSVQETPGGLPEIRDDYRSYEFRVENVTESADTVFVGEDDVTESTGLPWDGAAPFVFRLEAGEELWATVAAEGTEQELRVMRQGR